jgi:two-component system, LytTR family, response regulator
MRLARNPVQGRRGIDVTVRVLIVDDEAVARRRIRRLLSAEADVTIIGECADGRSAVEAFARDRPEIAFLDIQMPELDGFDVLQAVAPDARPGIVFVTAFDRFALRAFDVHAIDYLLKPFTRERFRTALSRARERLERRGDHGRMTAFVEHLRTTRRSAATIAVRTGDRIVVINWDDVDWIEAADNYVTLHVGGKEFLLRETLTSIEQQLDPERFVRIHRSTIVPINRIAELRPAGHGDVNVVLRNGARLLLTRTWRDRLQNDLQTWLKP